MTTTASGVIELERRIAARPETVFAYFTDPERYRQWQGVDAELDPRPGGIFRVRMAGRSQTVARGTYVDVEPPHRIVFTWGWEQNDGLGDGARGLPPGSSTVEVVLIADGDATILRVRHRGLPDETSCKFHSYGWGWTLDRLAAVATGADPGPYPLADL
ncbi:MAG: SRPBCC family protein [Actinomycetota bacterium]